MDCETFSRDRKTQDAVVRNLEVIGEAAGLNIIVEPSSREFFEQIEVRARYFGGLVGVRYGEPYRSVEPLCVNDPLPLIVP